MTHNRTFWLCLLAGLLLTSFAAPAATFAQETKAQHAQQQQATDAVKVTDQDEKKAEEKTQFVRLVRDNNGTPSSLDTAVTTYIGKNSKGEEVRVALLGAIHIGDEAYYQELSEKFKTYDVLLYELVAPKGARPGQGQESMYAVIARYLGLSDQLANIDYTAENFVHADMSGDDFLKSMEERGESFIKMFFKAMGQAMAQQQKAQEEGREMPNDFEIIMAMISGDKTKLKQAIAPTFENMEMSMALFEGPEGSTIITERNKVALEVLKEQIEAGHTNIGIFYGAGHFNDMEQRLFDDFELKVEKQEWLKAWNMAPTTPAG